MSLLQSSCQRAPGKYNLVAEEVKCSARLNLVFQWIPGSGKDARGDTKM